MKVEPRSSDEGLTDPNPVAQETFPPQFEACISGDPLSFNRGIMCTMSIRASVRRFGFPFAPWIACSTKSPRNRSALLGDTSLWGSLPILSLDHLASERNWTSVPKVSGVAYRD